jgi:uncharacterized protein YjbI with pentapeptide repeats
VKLRYVLLAIIIVVFAILAIVVLWLAVDQVSLLWNPKGLNAKDLFKARNDTLTTFAQILGGFAVLIGLYFAWRNITATAETTAKNLELTNQNLELTKEGQVTERFTRAIEQLAATDDKGQPKLELCLGGIYALERIARDSEKDHWTIMEVMTTYVREHAHWKEADSPALQEAHWTDRPSPNPLATDIQAILTVIHRRMWIYEKSDQRLNLDQTDLHNANLSDAHLERAHLEGAFLRYAVLANTNLQFANLDEAHLEGAFLRNAKLSNAGMEGTNLRGANLWDAHMNDANLSQADLRGADLTGAYLKGAHMVAHLRGASLRDADLEGAIMMLTDLTGVDLTSAVLKGAMLDGADLTNAIGVTQEQIDSAIGDTSTKLPADIVMPESWKKKVPWG